jgi:hypothetical protein
MDGLAEAIFEIEKINAKVNIKIKKLKNRYLFLNIITKYFIINK